MVVLRILIWFSLLPPLSLANQIPLKNGRSSPFTPGFDQFVNDNLNHWRVPGVAIAVVDGEETFSRGYGIATFPDSLVTPSTLFYTASTTKSFTAAAVSLLIDDTSNSSERLSWQTPLADLMRDDFLLPDEYTTAHATIEDALSHRTGMPRHDFSYGSPNTSVRDVVRNLRNLPLTAEIRSKWQYCNMMYMTISHFIETWTGMWLGDFLKKRIYEPLSMKSTFFSLKDAQAAASAGGGPLATPYYWLNHSQVYSQMAWLDAPQNSGAGGTISNVLDYAKWIRCHMTNSAPLSQAGHEAIHLPRMISGPLMDGSTGFQGSEAYAFGWSVSSYRGETMLWHTGGLPGFTSIMLYLPRPQWGMTMMTNGGDGSVIQVLMFKMLDDMLDIPERERYDWTSDIELKHKGAFKELKNATDVLYPHAPKGKAAIPLSLPLASYAGTYTNDGYQPLTLTLNNSHQTTNSPVKLHCSFQFEDYPVSFTLTHISGEYFLVYGRAFTDQPRRSPDDHEPIIDTVTKAEFRLGENGEVSELGIILTKEMGEAKIWFTKEGVVGEDRYERCSKARQSTSHGYQGSSAGEGKTELGLALWRSVASLFASVQ